MKKTIKIKCKNGISFKEAMSDIFFELHDDFDFIDSEDSDFILFGPYGNDIPPPGNYIRIGYFCENIIPDLESCEYAFGIPSKSEITDERYQRIQWHGINPEVLVKRITENEIDEIVQKRNKFCNFVYSNPVSYRENFFKQLSKYKKIDAPGRSMNNMPSFDKTYSGNFWERKKKFLSEYKFTIAFENYSYPGYQTEKLYDPMQLNSLPIYCGDRNVNEIFNTKSFLFVNEYTQPKENSVVHFLEKNCQYNFKDYRPSFYNSPLHRIKRKLKYLGKEVKMKLQYSNLNFENVIQRIVEIDKDDTLYAQYLREPWFLDNNAPTSVSLKESWEKIFNSK